MEVQKSVNITSQYVLNTRSRPSSSDILYVIAFTCIPSIFGTYFMHQIITYLKQKPLNQKTLLDGHNVQVFASWIIIGWLMIVDEVIILTRLNRIEEITFILGWMNYFAVMLFNIYMVVGCGIRFFLIFYPHVIEEINDDQILFITG